MPSSTRTSRSSPSEIRDLARTEERPEAARPEPTRPSISRRNDGWLAALKRTLAPRPVTVSNSLFGSKTSARPMTARAKIGVTEEQRHKPDPQATTQSAVIRHSRNVARTLAGAPSGTPAAGARVGPNALLIERGGTEAVAARLFNPAGLNGEHALPRQIAEDLRVYLAAPAGAADDVAVEAAARQELVLRRMTQGFGTDAAAARAALDGLVAADAPLATEHGAFDLARRLAASALGHSTLNALCGSGAGPVADHNPVTAAIRHDAQRLAFCAANALIDALPEGAARPASMADVKAIALAALAPHERPQGTPSNAPPTPMKADVNVPAKALLAALQLAADPAAEPERHLKSAYFAWRCGFTHEGPGTPLAHAQHRIFKLSRYARRASAPGILATIRRTFGFNKSPMSSLAMGTGGASLRQPDEDFHKAGIVQQLGDVFKERAQARPDAPLAARIDDALKSGTLDQWYLRIAHKGWRDKTTVTPTMRRAIAARAAELTGASVDQVKQSPAYAALKGGRSLLRPRGGAQLDVDTLRQWAVLCEPAPPDAATPDQAGAAQVDMGALLAGVDKLATLERNGEVALDTSTPQTVLENFKRVISEPRMTYDVRLSDGGQAGLNLNVGELINLPVVKHIPFIPYVLAGPDVKLIHGRHAMINGGSSANHGQLFIGSDRRISAHAGVSATAGITLFGKKANASGSVQVLPLMVDRSHPKGVMIRSRLQPLGTAPAGQQPAGQPDPWRAKMLSVIEAATASGPNGGLPGDADAMWNAMSHAFYKDPDVSVNWLDSHGTSVSSSAGISAGVRYQHNNWKVGPQAGIGGTKNWITRTRRQETPGPLRADYAGSTSARQVGVSASLVAAAPPQGEFSGETGHVKSVALPSAAIIGVGTTILQSETGSVWRIAEEDGHIDAAYSYRDTTFTSMKQMKHYVDSRRGAWDDAYRHQPPGAAVPEPIDQYLARVEQDATVGNQVFAERVWLRPDAARKVNLLRELRDALVPPGAVPDAATLADIGQRNTQIAAVLESDQSWDKRFFYSLEITGEARAVGPNFMVAAQHVSEVAHPHQLSLLRAERPVAPTGQ